MLAEASSLGGRRGGGAAAVGMGQGSTAEFLLQAVEPRSPRPSRRRWHTSGHRRDEGREGLTRLGRHLGEMPVHPRVGKMLLYATFSESSIRVDGCVRVRVQIPVRRVRGRGPRGRRAARRGFSDEAGAAPTTSPSPGVRRVGTGEGARRRRRRRQFNTRNSLSGATLNMLRGMRRQLVSALSSRGWFVTSGTRPETRRRLLVRAVLAVGMYPLMGRLLVPGAGPAGGRGHEARSPPCAAKVKIHPHSVNCKLTTRSRGPGPMVPVSPRRCSSASTSHPRREPDVRQGEHGGVRRRARPVAASLTVEALPPSTFPTTTRRTRRGGPAAARRRAAGAGHRARRSSWRMTGSSFGSARGAVATGVAAHQARQGVRGEGAAARRGAAGRLDAAADGGGGGSRGRGRRRARGPGSGAAASSRAGARGLELSSGLRRGVRVEGGVFSAGRRGSAPAPAVAAAGTLAAILGEGEGEEGVGVGEGVSFPAQGTRGADAWRISPGSIE